MTDKTPQIDIPSIDELNWETIRNYDYSGVSELIVTYSMQILAALAIFFIGRLFVALLIL
jgi:hypothetical protein